MDKLFNQASIFIGFMGGIAAKLWGNWDILLSTLVILMIIDYATGVIKAVYTKRLSSETGFKGLCKKVVILLIVAVGNLIGSLMSGSIALREIVITFFIANEGISILENAAVIYPHMPESLKGILLQLRNKDGEDR